MENIAVFVFFTDPENWSLRCNTTSRAGKYIQNYRIPLESWKMIELQMLGTILINRLHSKRNVAFLEKSILRGLGVFDHFDERNFFTVSWIDIQSKPGASFFGV